MRPDASVAADPAGGVIRVGRMRVEASPAGTEGELRVGGDGGTVLRPLRFGERTAVIVAASAQPRIEEAVAASVLAAATVREGGGERLLLETIALWMAGAAWDAPSYAETALLVGRVGNWRLHDVLDAPAEAVDRLAAHLGDQQQRGGAWKTLIFQPAAGEDAAAIRKKYVEQLLRRSNSDEQPMTSRTDDADAEKDERGRIARDARTGRSQSAEEIAARRGRRDEMHAATSHSNERSSVRDAHDAHAERDERGRVAADAHAEHEQRGRNADDAHAENDARGHLAGDAYGDNDERGRIAGDARTGSPAFADVANAARQNLADAMHSTATSSNDRLPARDGDDADAKNDDAHARFIADVRMARPQASADEAHARLIRDVRTPRPQASENVASAAQRDRHDVASSSAITRAELSSIELLRERGVSPIAQISADPHDFSNVESVFPSHGSMHMQMPSTPRSSRSALSLAPSASFPTWTELEPWSEASRLHESDLARQLAQLLDDEADLRGVER
jgi:hypothetical protein